MRAKIHLVLACAALAAAGSEALARHVTHSVTPQNIDKQPYGFTVSVKDAPPAKGAPGGAMKEFTIEVRKATAPIGDLNIGGGRIGVPSVTMVKKEDVATYTFAIAAEQVNRAWFTFTETPQYPQMPFARPGDYYVFDLKNFVGR
jgi:hypothetical protein